jgi:hypothetical protein
MPRVRLQSGKDKQETRIRPRAGDLLQALQGFLLLREVQEGVLARHALEEDKEKARGRKKNQREDES